MFPFYLSFLLIKETTKFQVFLRTELQFSNPRTIKPVCVDKGKPSSSHVVQLVHDTDHLLTQCRAQTNLARHGRPCPHSVSEEDAVRKRAVAPREPKYIILQTFLSNGTCATIVRLLRNRSPSLRDSQSPRILPHGAGSKAW